MDEDIKLDMIDISIMSILVELDSTSPLFSTTTKVIAEKITRVFKHNLAYPTLARRLQRLKDNNYISESFKTGNSKSFYITEKGTLFMDTIIKKEGEYGVKVEMVDENNNDMEEVENE